ncbi:MAG: hypothetical protein IPL27_15040 [Lewinellaceae bacterium]|nr:hypothetical protein [Lewinellaceae bacterium]
MDIPGENDGAGNDTRAGDNYNYNEIYINGKLVVLGLYKGTRKILIPPLPETRPEQTYGQPAPNY